MTHISDHGELDFLTPQLTDEEKKAASGFLAAIRERRKQLNAQDRDREIRANERAIANFHFQRFMP
jgi:hypothetical protein